MERTPGCSAPNGHRGLVRTVVELQRSVSGPDRRLPTEQWRTLQAERMERLLQQLEIHWRGEEEADGLYARLRALAPDESAELSHLQDQHGHLRRVGQDICESLRVPLEDDPRLELSEALEGFLRILAEHEAAEERFVERFPQAESTP